MALENIRCYKCDEYGHLAKDCPGPLYNPQPDGGKPPWCGHPACDPDTRLTYASTPHGPTAARCPACHPRARTLPAQFTRCRKCGKTVYEWDRRSECGEHPPVGRLKTEGKEITRRNAARAAAAILTALAAACTPPGHPQPDPGPAPGPAPRTTP